MIFDDVQKVYIGNIEVTKALLQNIELYTSTITPVVTADPYSDYVSLLLNFNP